MTENGNPVGGQIGIEAPGTTSGVVLLIDASRSMEGEPIEGAMAAARAFMASRSEGDAGRRRRVQCRSRLELTGFTTDDLGALRMPC